MSSPKQGRMDEATARRNFLKTVGKATVTAPAVALLLAASATPASANGHYGPTDSECDQECESPDFVIR